jgi:hypothetical protein
LRAVGNIIWQVLGPLNEPVNILALLNVELSLLIARHKSPLRQVHLGIVFFNFFLNLFFFNLIGSISSNIFSVELLMMRWLLLLLFLLSRYLLSYILGIIHVYAGCAVYNPLVEVVK